VKWATKTRTTFVFYTPKQGAALNCRTANPWAMPIQKLNLTITSRVFYPFRASTLSLHNTCYVLYPIPVFEFDLDILNVKKHPVYCFKDIYNVLYTQTNKPKVRSKIMLNSIYFFFAYSKTAKSDCHWIKLYYQQNIAWEHLCLFSKSHNTVWPTHFFRGQSTNKSLN